MAGDGEQRRMGRPSSFTQEVADEILMRLANGQSLMDICEAEGMPHRATVWSWRRANKDFHDAITRARAEGTEARMEEDERIARQMLDPGESGKRYEPAAVREFLSYRRWVNEAFNPALSPRNKVELSGGLDLRNKPTDDLLATLAATLAGIGKRDEQEQQG